MAKDFTKYLFKGEKYSKGRLVLAVVKQYVTENPNVTYSELREIFSGEDYKGDVLIDTDDYQQWKSSRKDNQDRFFMADGINLADGTVVYISNQWTVSWMNLFLGNMKGLGYSIVAEMQNGAELEELFQKYLKNPRKKWIESYRTRSEELINEINDNTGEFSEEFLSTFWREGGNGVSSVGQGALSHEEFRSVKKELTNLLREIHVDPSPKKFEEVMVWVQKKVKKEQFRNQKNAVVKRIFASISPENYTTVTEKGDLNSRLKILSETYGIKLKSTGNWAEVNKSLTRVVRQELSTDDPFLINTFIWELPKLVGIETDQDESEHDYEEVVMGNINPQNIILFGPPGTGKTYATIAHAVSLATQSNVEKIPRVNLVKNYKDLEKDKRICFTTFHQSFSYEDFIEGIKPILDDDSNDVRYEIATGLFKDIAERALKNYRLSQLDIKTIETENYFNELIQAFSDFIIDELQNGPVPLTPSVSIVSVEKNCFRYKGEAWSIQQGNKILFSELETSYKNDVKTRKELKKQEGISGLAKQHATYQFYMLEKLREFDKTFKNQNKSDNYSKEKVELEHFVIVIDEINRGNVSSIFGELITLIESDKRLGMPNAVTAVLPYSKQPFSVPPNLHILATMNTADRSVESLDSALRRRFVFLECPPEYDLLKSQNILWQVLRNNHHLSWGSQEWNGIQAAFFVFFGVEVLNEKEYMSVYDKNNDAETIKAEIFDNCLSFKGLSLSKLLETINYRIERLLDKDHQIGHSYFLDVVKSTIPFEALQEAFKNKIIPLLEEYFFGQPEKIGMVLGPSFVSEKKEVASAALFSIFDEDMSVYREKKLYEIKVPTDLTGFISVYEA